MKLESEGGRSPVDRLRETPRLDLVKRVLEPNLESLGRGRELYLHDLESAARDGSGNSARARALDTVQAKRPVSPLGDAIQGVLSAHRGQPVAGLVLATDGRSNTGEDPLRAAEAAIRQNIPIFAIAAGAGEGPRNIRLAEIEASPVVFVRDPMTLAVVVEAPRPARRRGDDRPGTTDQRRGLGTGRQSADRAGRGRHPQAVDVPDHAQGRGPV